MRKNWRVVRDLPPSRGEVLTNKFRLAGYVFVSMAIAATLITSTVFLGWVLGSFLHAIFSG